MRHSFPPVVAKLAKLSHGIHIPILWPKMKLFSKQRHLVSHGAFLLGLFWFPPQAQQITWYYVQMVSMSIGFGENQDKWRLIQDCNARQIGRYFIAFEKYCKAQSQLQLGWTVRCTIEQEHVLFLLFSLTQPIFPNRRFGWTSVHIQCTELFPAKRGLTNFVKLFQTNLIFICFFFLVQQLSLHDC